MSDVPMTATLLEFPVRGREDPWRLTSLQVKAWQGLYPELEVLVECRHALAWCHANPSKRKMPSKMPRFLVSWLSRASREARQAPTRPARLGPPQGLWEWSCDHSPRCASQSACHVLQQLGR